MGTPKQLLPIGNRPLLRHVVEASFTTLVSPVIVVLGAHAGKIRPSLLGLPVRVIVNRNWKDGMGASVRAGLKELMASAPKTMAAIIALADQPGFSSDHVARLLHERRRTGRSIIASEFGGKTMPPVLFGAAYFPELLALQGEFGARNLLQAHRQEVATVPMGRLGDLDTPADYTEYLKQPASLQGPLKT